MENRLQKESRKNRLLTLFVLLFVGFLVDCTGRGLFETGPEFARRIGMSGGLKQILFKTSTFHILGYHSPVTHGGRLRIYIEGDGRAFVGPGGLVSRDPTPGNPLALRLAALDRGGATAYLARPCQYVRNGPVKCEWPVWSVARFGEPEIKAMLDSVRQLIQLYRPRELELVGYSGGGVMAVLLAALEPRVDRIITVAAPIDHAVWSELMEVPQLSASLHPRRFLSKLRLIPQIHLRGSGDQVVPRQVLDSYLNDLGAAAPVRHLTFKNFDHVCCWIDQWPSILARATTLGRSLGLRRKPAPAAKDRS